MAKVVKVYMNRPKFEEIAAQKNMAIIEIAQASDIDKGTLYGILNRNQAVSPVVRRKLLEFFKGIEWHDLFRLEKAKKRNA